LTDIRRLILLGDARLQSCERALGNTRRRLQPVESELQGIEMQINGLRALLAGSQLNGVAVSHQGLLSGLRQQAVIRRKLQKMLLERVRVERTREQIEQQLKQDRERQLALQRKKDKYVHLHDRCRAAWRNERHRLDERETEDHLTSKR
jgi:hypothetical protein